MIEVDEVCLPSASASALANGDFSGLTLLESDRCERAIKRLAHDGWQIVGKVAGSTRFTANYELFDRASGFYGGDVADYYVQRPMLDQSY